MSSTCWYKLWNELNHRPDFDGDREVLIITYWEGPIHANKYPAYMMDLASRFIGECRRNMEELGKVPAEFGDLREKLNHYFKSEYNVDCSNELVFPIEHLSGVRVEIRYTGDDPDLIVLSAKADAFILAYNHLNDFLQSPPQRRARRINSDNRDFRVINTNINLPEILRSGQRLRLISSETNQTTFDNIFRGRPVDDKINWTGTVYLLKRFFQGINGIHINKLNHGKWEIVSQLFNVNGTVVSTSQLENASSGRNERTEDLDRFISNFETE